MSSGVKILIGDCRERLKELPDNSVDSVVCDPPYHLTSIVKRFGAENAAPAQSKQSGVYARSSKGFMGQTWDGGDVAFQPETWAEVLRVLKPGGHLLAFSGTRTYHRLACAVEDAGFEVRDMISWLYGSGFPKSHDISKAIDKAAGAEREVVGPNKFAALNGKANANVYGVASRPDETAPATESAREWEGWGTALKPACEPIVLARKPLSEKNIAANVLKWGTGALNIDGCRIEAEERPQIVGGNDPRKFSGDFKQGSRADGTTSLGRWPANLCHDGSEEVLAGFPDVHGAGSEQGPGRWDTEGWFGKGSGHRFGDSGSAARFFFEAKYSEDELLFCRAKAMLLAWSQELANSADDSSSLSNEHAVFALRLAVTLALPEGRRLSALTGLSTSATPTELNNLAMNFIAAILSFESGCLPAWLQGKPTPDGSPVQFAGTPRPTDTITITISHWKSSGCAEPVTFSITPQSLEPGARDLAPARFKYCAKATTEERGEGNTHPTVKPIALMRWLVRLVTPKGGTVLDPFMGSGSTLIAADMEQMKAIGCELSPEYAAIAERRLREAAGMFADVSVCMGEAA